MAYTFELDGEGDAKEIALIRDEIDDISSSTAVNGGVVGTDYFFTDERILARLRNLDIPSDASASYKRLLAAASILDTLATNQAYVQKKQRTLSQETDGPSVAASIRAHARALEKKAAEVLKTSREEKSAAASALNSPSSQSVPVRQVW